MDNDHRKVFLSILGTGKYQSCKYHSGDFVSSETCFIQQATLELIKAREWTKDDIVYIFVTPKAEKANWQEKPVDIRGDVKEYAGLSIVLKDMHLPCPYELVMISEDGDEKAIWEVFDTIYKVLKPEDELYIDVTHSFRYLPMLLLVLCNYAKFLKGTTIKHISYGNWEAETEDKPIVDLMPLVELQGWTLAASEFLRSGRSEALAERTEDRLNATDKNNDHAKESIEEFNDALKEVSESLMMVRGKAIIGGEPFQKLDESINHLDVGRIEPLPPVVDALKKSFEEFDRSYNVTNGFKAARWCNEKKLYQQSLTILQETLKAYAVYEADSKKIKLDEFHTRMADTAFYIANCNPKKWKLDETDPKQRESQKKVIRKYLKTSVVRDMHEVFDVIRELRNDFNHAGIRRNPTPAAEIPDRIGDEIDKVFKWIENSGEGQGVRQDQEPVGEPLFVNLSNHPIDKWGEAQLEAAQAYGEPVDMPFPEIDPQADEEEVRRLAEEYADRIEESYPGRALTIHVMGEMTFTYYLVELLQQRDIRCVASTTRRLVTEKEDGVKEVRFDFVRFRPYL